MNPEITDEATRITAEIVESDPGRVAVYFKWTPRVWAHGIQAGVIDGEVYLYLHLEDARELHRKLGEALSLHTASVVHPPDIHGAIGYEHAQEEADEQQGFADAGHPDPEEAMAEAEAQHDLAANR